MNKPRLERATRAAYERHCADTLRLDGHALDPWPDLKEEDRIRWGWIMQAAIEEWER